LLRRVKKYIRDNGLLTEGGRVLVGVSGGADSVALLDVLQRGGYDCWVAHCNFHLRGEESDRDEEFVRGLGDELVRGLGDKFVRGLGDEAKKREAQRGNVKDTPLNSADSSLDSKDQTRVMVKHFNTEEYARKNGLSIEMAARELRYQWFAELAEAEGCKAIAVAHHQHDQAETVLLNLRRGTGIRGLCGMRAKSANPYGGMVPVIRPLLCTTRDYIEHYLRDIRHFSWVEDSTNNDVRIKRNAVREQLKNYSKAEIEHIAATAEHMQGYVDWLEGRESREAGQVKLYEELKEYGFAEINKIYDALQRGIGGKEFRSATHKAVIHKGELVIEAISDEGRR
jgi:tRNA(Ile)-lysidine synthase